MPHLNHEACGNLRPKHVGTTFLSMLKNVQDTNLAACVTSRIISVLKSTTVFSVHSQVPGNSGLKCVLCIELELITY